MSKLKSILKWIFGVGCIIFGLFAFSTTVIGGILFLIAGAFLIPPVFTKINSKGKINRTLKIVTPILAIFAAFIAIGISEMGENDRSIEERREEEVGESSQDQEVTEVSQDQERIETGSQENGSSGNEISNSSTTESTLIKSFSGSGGKNTRPFSVAKGWEIQWDANGDLFQLHLYDSEGEIVGIPANQQGPGQGNSYQAQGGEYYLHVNALGNWKIQIVQVTTLNDTSKPSKNGKGDVEFIASFDGSGGKNTRPFTVPSGWEIQWDANGDLFQLFLYNTEGEIVGVPANQKGAGTGNSYQAKGGEYYLQVNALGDWTINIADVR